MHRWSWGRSGGHGASSLGQVMRAGGWKLMMANRKFSETQVQSYVRIPVGLALVEMVKCKC
jgi:hypothetical protein